MISKVVTCKDIDMKLHIYTHCPRLVQESQLKI